MKPMTNESFSFNGVDTSIKRRYEPFAKALLETLSNVVHSIYLTGASARNELEEANGRIHSAVIVEQVTLKQLLGLSRLGKKYGAKGIEAPLLLPMEHVRGGGDVFPMEFLDFKENHRCVMGENLFATLQITEANLRRQCERELRLWGFQLQDAAVRSAGDFKWLGAWLDDSVMKVFPILRAVYRLLGGEKTGGNTVILKGLQEKTSISLDAILTVYEAYKKGSPLYREAEIEAAVTGWLEAIAALTEQVDAL